MMNIRLCRTVSDCATAINLQQGGKFNQARARQGCFGLKRRQSAAFGLMVLSPNKGDLFECLAVCKQRVATS